MRQFPRRAAAVQGCKQAGPIGVARAIEAAVSLFRFVSNPRFSFLWNRMHGFPKAR